MRRGQVVERGGAERGGGAKPSQAIRRRYCGKKVDDSRPLLITHLVCERVRV